MATDDMFATQTTPSEKPDQSKQNRPLTNDEKVDVGSEDSMDASDPPAVVAPGDSGDPVPSSGFDEAKERARGAE